MWYVLSNQHKVAPPREPDARTSRAARHRVSYAPDTRGFRMDDVLRQAEALLRFSGEVENRMAESGLGGVNGVIERYVQLREALDRLSQRELDWAKGEVDRLIATLNGVAEQLEQLRAIKLAIIDQS